MANLLNSAFAGQLGRPDAVFMAQDRSLYASSPPTVVGGSGGFGIAAPGSIDGALGGGRHILVGLLALVGAYAAFVWWVRPHLA